MSDIDTGGPAFPHHVEHISGWAEPYEHMGMTLRDYFAAAFVSSGHVFKTISAGNTPSEVANQAYVMADAMLKARAE